LFYLNKPLRFLLIIVVVSACSPTKDNFFNRSYQNLVARDNPYFNAREKLKESVKALNASHLDDHTKVLDVYAYGTEKDSKGMLPQMDEIYKKCSNVIQRRPLSKWIDDTYMLIGKSHFFKRDYFAALEVFQYVSSKYKDKNPVIAKEAEIWIAKCYLYMDKPGEAEAVISLLMAEKNFPKELTGFLNATAAAVYIRQEKYISALPKMKIAVAEAKGRKDKIRYNYILAQLYEEAGQNGAAIAHYRQVIKRTPAYEFEFNSKLSIARLYNPANKNAAKQVRRDFKKLLRDDKNIDYFDQIYYEMGNIEYREKKIPEAIKFYKQSVLTSKSNQKQKSLSYYALARLYFAQPEYPLAQAYYDSLSTTMPPDFPDYKKIMDTRNVLSELIKNMTVIRTEDSLQSMAKLSPDALEKKINYLIEKEKQRKAEEAKSKKLKDQQAKNQAENTNAMQQNVITASTGVGSWYFYNPVSVNQGKTDFIKKWGDRKLEDNWRISSKEKELALDDPNAADTSTTKQVEKKDEQTEEKEQDLISNVPADKKKFYENLPTTSKALKESDSRIMEAYYNLGIIYQEKLDDDREATKTFDTLLKRYPSNKFEPEVLYRLYKMHVDARNQELADKYKKQLIDKYPMSEYALILSGKSNRDNNTDRELEAYYQTTYEHYKKFECEQVLSKVSESDRLFPGSVLKPKFDLLRSFCIGRTVAQDSFRVVLQNVAESYPGTDVAEKAKQVIAAMKEMAERRKRDSLQALMPKDSLAAAAKKSKNYDFSGNDEKHFYIIVLPLHGIAIGDLKARVADYNSEFHQLESLQISALVLSDDKQLFVVKEFPNDKKAMGYLKEFEETNKILQTFGITDYEHFIISSTNFVKLLRGKNLPEYLEMYKQKFK